MNQIQLIDLVVSLRPTQWLKNLAVFAAILFSKDLFEPVKSLPVFYTFLIFCASSSAIYLINDVVDKQRDSLHFSKKRRPIAAGSLPANQALLVATALIIVSLVASVYLQGYLFLILVIFLIFQLLYTFTLKDVIILDVLAIAFAFMLRVFAGSVVVLSPLSSWLILTTMMFSLFLGIGKRRSEHTLLAANVLGKHRKTLLSYPQVLLDGLVFMMATATLITYSLFTFSAPEAQGAGFFTPLLPSTLAKPKILMITIPLVVYGIFRYLYLVFEKREGESPEKVLLSDGPLLLTVVFWVALVVFLLYFSTF